MNRDSIDARRTRRVGRRLQIRVIVQEMYVEQSDDSDRIFWRGRGRRASANGDGSENQERRNPQPGKPRATGRCGSTVTLSASAAAVSQCDRAAIHDG